MISFHFKHLNLWYNIIFMDYVTTLIANPAKLMIDNTIINRVMEYLASEGAETILSPKILSQKIAVDVPFIGPSSLNVKRLMLNIQRHFDDVPIDIVIQVAAGRRKKLLIADMDSTMIEQECIDELAAEVGLKEKVAAITERAMRGEIAFEGALRERVSLLRGLSVLSIPAIIDQRISLMPGGVNLVQTMQANGAYCVLVSGGFTLFSEPIAKKIGFFENRANILIEENAQLTGGVIEPILGREAKREWLFTLARQQGIAIAETLAVGDGANDVAMIEAAGLGVAFHAKPKVAALADIHIQYCDLTALLYLQGYYAGDFI